MSDTGQFLQDSKRFLYVAFELAMIDSRGNRERKLVFVPGAWLHHEFSLSSEVGLSVDHIVDAWASLTFGKAGTRLYNIDIWRLIVDRFGKLASSTAPHTWCHLDEARKALESGIGDGIGFVFTRASGITGIDLDHCRDASTGEIDAWAEAYLNRLNSYSEISPSGEGIHILVKGALPSGVDGKRKNFAGDGYRPKAGIEMYCSGRYFTMTGARLADYPKAVPSKSNPPMDSLGEQDAEAALAAEVEAIRACPISDRREQLKKSACVIGKLVSAGLLKVSNVTTALGIAAERSGILLGHLWTIQDAAMAVRSDIKKDLPYQTRPSLPGCLAASMQMRLSDCFKAIHPPMETMTAERTRPFAIISRSGPPRTGNRWTAFSEQAN